MSFTGRECSMSSHLGHHPRSPTCDRDWQIELERAGQRDHVRGSFKAESAPVTFSPRRGAAQAPGKT
eukprot:6629521-Prymnesium_polylepis.1